MPDTAIRHPAIAAAAASDVGLRRENNEDRYTCDPASGLFVVVDGVGGHAAGEHAAETALRMLRTRLSRETGSPGDRLREAITLANNEVHRLAGSDPALEGMACVLTAALVADGRLTAGHVGDTRLYTFARGAARKLTHDHSPVGEREDRGELDERDAMRHPRRNEIYRDVGSAAHNPNDDEFVELVDVPFEPESAFLICSDGLSDQVSSPEIARIVYEHPDDPATIVGRLVQAANEAGGKDNVTAVFFAGERFAEVARREWPRRAASPEDHDTPRTRARERGRWFLSPPLLAGYGVLAGVALAALSFVLLEPVAGWLLEQSRPASWARTWRVEPEGGGDAATIGEALRLASPGDTISVAPGEYREGVLVDRDLTLVSRNPRQARLAPPAAAEQPWTAVQVRAGVASRISGFAIAASPGAPLAVGIAVGQAAVEIDDVEISGAETAGLLLENGSRALLRSSYVHDNPGTGVVVAPGALPRLLHNVIAANGRGARSGHAGIEVAPGVLPELFGNIVAGNGPAEVAGPSAALLQEWQHHNTIGIAAPAKPARPGGARRSPAPPVPTIR
ncbi:MAG TPA: protein phosphatase 2C domain-containing protein [Vicinamibacterales bacterium]|nr:protein phosphatase 2C domain-containing protein [Acidobacteriota bacterium]HOC17993.1 protein phosphatase 2C domain-containing protein [Vicinamibacterales bacterium]